MRTNQEPHKSKPKEFKQIPEIQQIPNGRISNKLSKLLVSLCSPVQVTVAVVYRD